MTRAPTVPKTSLWANPSSERGNVQGNGSGRNQRKEGARDGLSNAGDGQLAFTGGRVPSHAHHFPIGHSSLRWCGCDG